MANNQLPTRLNGAIIDDTWFNDIKNALITDFVPRDADGNPLADAGKLGAAATQFLKAFISQGHFKCGDIKVHHNYGGAAPIGHGWMLCDGRQVNQTNYDLEHGSGSWDIYILSSPLQDKYLPDCTARYLIGAATTPQDGSIAITPVGNAGNSTAGFTHTHRFMHDFSDTWDSSGASLTGSDSTSPAKSILGRSLRWTSGQSTFSDLYVSKLLSSLDVTPLSIEYQMFMRVI